MYYRLIKPEWAKPISKATGRSNKDFVQEIDGPDVIGDLELSDGFIEEKNKLGYNVYFFPNYPSTPPTGTIQDKDIDVFQYIYIDIDAKQLQDNYGSGEKFLESLKKFKPVPTTVTTSGNGYHVYWRVSDLDQARFLEGQLRLIAHFKSDASIWNPSRIMRLPGTINTKKFNELKKCQELFEYMDDGTYTFEDVMKTIQPLSERDRIKLDLKLSRLNGTYKSIMDQTPDFSILPEKFIKLMKKEEGIRRLFENPIETSGDRSSADYALCNKLFEHFFNKNEVFQVLMHTKKAREYQGNPEDYVTGIIDKVFKMRPTHVASTVKAMTVSGKLPTMGERIYGPSFMDRTHSGWRRTEVLGLIAGEGIGKSTLALSMFRHIARNNTGDGLLMYFSLEMPAHQMIKRWKKGNVAHEDFDDRLYIISNEDEDGNPIRIGLQEIYWTVRHTEQVTGKKVLAITIDHIAAISPVIDTTKIPNFNLINNADFGFDSKKSMPLERICAELKTLAKELDVFIIAQSQTTKSKSGVGDIPIEGNAAYGISHFDWYCDYIITAWQPLRRVQKEIDLKVTSFQYCKIREQDEENRDRITVYDWRLLVLDSVSKDFRPMTIDEKSEIFIPYHKKAQMIRKMTEKKQNLEAQYDMEEVMDDAEESDEPINTKILSIKSFKDVKKPFND